MNIFEKKKISLLKEKVEAYRLEAHNHGRFSLFDTSFAIDFFAKDLRYDQFKSYYELIEDWDQQCNLPYNVGISLDKLAADNTVMIHRTHLGLDPASEGLTDNDVLFSIMNDGLKNFGHGNAVGGSAFGTTIPDLTLTLTPLKGLTGYINLLASYKSNDAIVITSFPKDLVNNDGEITQESKYLDVYDLSENVPRVKTDYIIGVILKKHNGLDEFYSRDEVIQTINSTKISNNH